MAKNIFGIIALIFGIIGFFTIIGFFICGIFSVLAIILGAIGIAKDNERRIAIAGLILGIISLVVGILFIIVFP
ncbi:MAG: DUF4190 domain-containing protein, partial [Candidatus Lokiarchaeota archaeon]